MQNGRAVVLLSGGLDSAVLAYDLHSQGFEVHALSVLYGQKHVKEIESARALASTLKIEHKIIDLHALQPLFAGSALTSSSVAIPHGHYNEESMKQTVVPNRNMLLISIATACGISCKADVIAYAAHAGDHVTYPDCRPQFVEAMQGAIELCDWSPPKLLTPFVHLSKGQIVKRGAQLNVPFEKTWSCYEGKDLHCGECGTCVARKEAFLVAEVLDPTQYEAV